MIRMKVEFAVDEFDRVSLFGASEILVRMPRKVPTEDETMLGDYILQKITSSEELVTSKQQFKLKQKLATA